MDWHGIGNRLLARRAWGSLGVGAVGARVHVAPVEQVPVAREAADELVAHLEHLGDGVGLGAAFAADHDAVGVPEQGLGHAQIPVVGGLIHGSDVGSGGVRPGRDVLVLLG